MLRHLSPTEAESAGKAVDDLLKDKRRFGEAYLELMVTLLSSRPHGLDTGFQPAPGETLVVLQHEVGHLRADNTVLHHIGSIDATSCVVIAFRTERCTALAHVDEGGPTLHTCMEEMLMRVEGEKGEGEVDVYLVGGVVERKHSLPTLIDIFWWLETRNRKTSSPKLFLKTEGSSFWKLNTAGDRCVHQGLVVDTRDGRAGPLNVPWNLRGSYPGQHLRELRVFAGSCPVSWITQDNEDPDSVTVVVLPYRWEPFPKHILLFKAEDFLRWSTTPTMEGEDFPKVMKGCAIFANTHKPKEIFGETESIPKVYRRTREEGWTEQQMKS